MRREVDLVTLLQDAVADDAVPEALASLRPQAPAYGRMVEALARYRTLAAEGGWPAVPAGETLEPGATDPRVLAVALRLHATGDLRAGHEGELYDEELAEAVRRFQARHGLEPDAKIGPKTLDAMNVSAADRAHQIELNLTRWRWLPQELGERFVLVNIPSFDLWVFEGTEPVMQRRVIVGRSYRRTPVFSDLIRYIVFNPSWEVPPSIAVQDKLPLIQKDPSFLAQQGFKVYSGWGAEGPIDPATVDWSALTRRSFPYRLRQDPGPLNALGRVKIMFPNRFNVYLHDTPARELFRQSDRDFSSGCIRVEQPLDLAELLLRGAPGWDRAAIDRTVASNKTVTVSLPEPVPVHLQYWTSWVDADGEVQFRRDLYGRDALLDEALRTRREAIVSGG
ncbi:MAG: L,D-transpeptidase family protein [Thermoanaerobaculia bacterium]